MAPGGFEPPTPGLLCEFREACEISDFSLKVQCSTGLSYGAVAQ